MPPKASIPRQLRERIDENEKKIAEGNQGTPPPAQNAQEQPTEQAPQAPQAGGAAPIPGARPGETAEETIRRMDAALKVLQGKYNKEVPTLMKENHQLKSRIGDPEERPAVEVKDRHRGLGDSWGVDPQELAGFEQEIVDRVQGKKQVPIERTTYIETLDALVGGSSQRAATINDPAFNQFLSMTDQGTGRVIRDIAVTADNANDSSTMAEIYRAFRTWQKTPAAKVSNSHPAPAGHGGGGSLDTNKKPIYSQSQVNDFQHKVKRGYFRTIGMGIEEAKKKLDEYNHWSDEFAAARVEGRIRG